MSEDMEQALESEGDADELKMEAEEEDQPTPKKERPREKGTSWYFTVYIPSAQYTSPGSSFWPQCFSNGLVVVRVARSEWQFPAQSQAKTRPIQ